MPRIDARLEKLETQARHGDEVVVFACRPRASKTASGGTGVTQTTSSVRYTVVRWACESDARL